MSSLVEWLAWLPVVGGVVGLLGWAVGLPAVLRFIANVSDVLAPVAKAVVSAVIGVLSWFWQTVCWPAIQDITDNWRTLVFVTMLVGSVALWMDTKADIRMDNVVDQLSSCQTDLTKLQRAHKVKPGGDWFWPLW